jgi:hypothetical protein
MALDTRIPMSYRGVEIQDPQNAMLMDEQIGAAKNKNALSKIELEQAQQPEDPRKAFAQDAKDFKEVLTSMLPTMNEQNADSIIDYLGANGGFMSQKFAENWKADQTPVAQKLQRLNDGFNPKKQQAAAFSGSTITGPDGEEYVLNKQTGQLMPTGISRGLKPTEQLDYQGQKAATTARESALAESQAKQQASLPNDIANTQYAVELLESLKTHPGRQMATGMTSMVPAIPGTDARDFNVRMDQLKGKQFLEAFNSLKGGGTITEVEGRKAEQAIGRLDTAQSEEEFMVSLNELQDILNAGMQRKQQGITVNSPMQQQQAPDKNAVIEELRRRGKM